MYIKILLSYYFDIFLPKNRIYVTLYSVNQYILTSEYSLNNLCID